MTLLASDIETLRNFFLFLPESWLHIQNTIEIVIISENSPTHYRFHFKDA